MVQSKTVPTVRFPVKKSNLQFKIALPNVPRPTFRTALALPNAPRPTFQTAFALPNAPRPTFRTAFALPNAPRPAFALPNAPRTTFRTAFALSNAPRPRLQAQEYSINYNYKSNSQECIQSIIKYTTSIYILINVLELAFQSHEDVGTEDLYLTQTLGHGRHL